MNLAKLLLVFLSINLPITCTKIFSMGDYTPEGSPREFQVPPTPTVSPIKKVTIRDFLNAVENNDRRLVKRAISENLFIHPNDLKWATNLAKERGYDEIYQLLSNFDYLNV